VTALADACAELRGWLPYLRVLRAQPDTSTVTGRSQPSSRPPWNAAADELWFDIHALARHLEAAYRTAVTGRPAVRGGSDRNTLAAYAAAARLAEALPGCPAAEYKRKADGTYETDAKGNRIPKPCSCARCDGIRQVARCRHAVRLLPAIDEEQPWRKMPRPCPHCGRAMLRYRERDYGQAGQVTCLGCRAEGRIMPGTVSGGYIEWADGTIT